jgi:hypothetical protein
MTLPHWLLFVIAIGAVVRLSRLVTADKITESIRERLTQRWGEDSLKAYLISCDYCVSIYVAPVVATVAVYWGDNRVVIIGLLALTASFIAGIIGAHE